MEDDGGDGNMVCTQHHNSPGGGICAFCLQEKLGKLVSSSFPIAVFPSSSSSSPSFRSDITTTTTIVPPPPPPPQQQQTSSSSSSSSLLLPSTNTTTNSDSYHHSRILYLLSQKKKKKNKDLNNNNNNDNLVFKRSKSTATPRHFMDADSPHKRGFWSFLYSHSTRKTLTNISSNTMPASAVVSFQQQKNTDNEVSPSFDRKVSRSRSVGCGSRSFSGDFFERISTGFGDCTLRRVESQREGKSKNRGQDNCIKERVRCGGLFSGFMITSSSSSSSSSSYWVASNPNEVSGGSNVTGKVTSARGQNHQQQHGRSKSWGWALASPMRAFGKPSSSSSIRRETEREASNKNQTPNLAAIPSLLSVST